MLYAVCTRCTFLRAFSRSAGSVSAPEECPACGGSLVVLDHSERFQPAYVGKVALDLHAAPPLDRPHERA